MDVLLFLPFALSSLLPHAQYHKNLQSSTCCWDPFQQLQLLSGSQTRLTSCLEYRGLGCVGEALTPGDLNMWDHVSVTCCKFGMQGVCKPGQLVQSGTERSRKKNMAGQKSKLLHALESSGRPAHCSWWQLHRLTICKGVVLLSVRPGPGPWPSCPPRAGVAVPVEMTYAQDSVSWQPGNFFTSHLPVSRSVALGQVLISSSGAGSAPC